MRVILPLILIVIVAVSCDPTDENQCVFIPDVSSIQVEVSIDQLQTSVTKINTKEELVDFFSQHTTMRDQFFNRNAYPSDSAFINELYNRFTNPYFDSLLIETQGVFGDLKRT